MKNVDPMDYAETILKALPKGILLTTKAEKVNTMFIGWGSLGTDWAKTTFVTYVRESRYTRTQLDKNPEFTVNIPLDGYDKKILQICGSKSGRDMDKIKGANLTLVDSQTISVPGIKELPLTLECRVVFRQKQEIPLIADKFQAFYPVEGGSRDAHIAYYGEIVNAYIAE